MNNRTKKIAFLAIAASAAMVLSYVELLIPPIYAALPAIKIGLPNVVIIFVLYRSGIKEAVCVSFIRLLLVTLLFGNLVMLAYSVAGATLSITAMAILKRFKAFSSIGVSVVGAVLHNLGQILMAILLLGTTAIGFYFPVLVFTGSIAGILVGIMASILQQRIKNNYT